MIENITQESKRLSCPTRKCCDGNVSKVLNAVGNEIKVNYARDTGTIIRDLGTFAISQLNIKIDGKKSLIVKEPVFLISEKLIQNFNLKADKKFVAAKIPTKMINFLSVECNTNLDKHTIESCIKSAIQAFTRNIKSGQRAAIRFPSVGTILVQNKRVKIQFDKCFLYDTKTETIERMFSKKEVPKHKESLKPLVDKTKNQVEENITTELVKRAVVSDKPKTTVPACKMCKAVKCVCKPNLDALSDTISVKSLTRRGAIAEPPKDDVKPVAETKPQDASIKVDTSPKQFASLPDGDPNSCYICQLRDSIRANLYAIKGEPKEVTAAKEKLINADIFKTDAENVIEDIQKCEARRAKNKDVSAFNRQLAEDNKGRYDLKLKDEKPMAYIFLNRKLTPPVSPRAWEENKILGEEHKRVEREAKEKEMEIDKQRTELSIKTSEEERWGAIENKTKSHMQYMKVLDAQIKHKEEYNKMYPNVDEELLDSNKPEFTIRNFDLEKCVAQDLDTYRKCQIKMRNDKEEQERQERLEYEKNWLRMLDEEGLKERERKKKLQCDMYEDLLRTWKENFKMKQYRDHEDKEYLSQPAGFLFQDNIRRCLKCFRNLGCPAQKITDMIKI